MPQHTDEEREQEQENEARFRLTDIQVQAVGLVPKGANRAEFFLLKSTGGNDMPDELDGLEVEEVVEETAADEVEEAPEGLLDKLKGFIRSAVQEEVQPLLAKADDEDEPEPQPEPDPPAPAPDVTELFKAELAEMRKAYEDQTTALNDRLEKSEAQVTELRQERDQAAQEAQRRDWIEKAANLPALPATATELGERLHRIAQVAEAEDVEYVLKMLRSADALLNEAGTWMEVGTSRSGDEATTLEKAERQAKEAGRTLEEALLDLDPQEQKLLLAEMRKGVK